MKNTIIRSLMCVAVALFAVACIQDKGNYEYQNRDDVFPVKIAQLPGDDILVAQGGTLEIKVDEYVTGDEGGGYIYEWYILEVGGGNLVKRILYSSTESPDLNMPVEGFRTGSYTFFLEVSSAEYGFFVRSSGVPVTVDSGGSFGEGWYVAKSTGDGHANIDYASTQFMVDGETDPETGLPKGLVRNNIITSLDLPVGDAFRIGYLPFYWADMPELDPDTGEPTGKTINYNYNTSSFSPSASKKSGLGAFMLATKSEMWSFDALDMTPIKTKWEDMFFVPDGIPRQVDEIRFYQTGRGMMGNAAPASAHNPEVQVIIGGKLYAASHLETIPGTGRFSSARIGVKGNSYDLGSYMANNGGGAQLVFDKTTKSFYYSTTAKNVLFDWSYPVNGTYSQPAGMPDLHNMDQELVWITDLAPAPAVCRATALTKTTGVEEYTLFIPGLLRTNATTQAILGTPSVASDIYPFERKLTVPTDSKLLQSTQRFMSNESSSVYFSTGNNEIWWFRTPETIDTGEREELLFTLPAGESIVRTKVVQNNPIGNHYLSVAVLSNDASGNWHIRTFPLTNNSAVTLTLEQLRAFNNKPLYHATGTGTAVDMTYRGLSYGLYS